MRIQKASEKVSLRFCDVPSAEKREINKKGYGEKREIVNSSLEPGEHNSDFHHGVLNGSEKKR